MIHVIAIITTKPGKREEVLKIFNANVPAVLAEEGCIEYGPTIDAKDAPAFQTALGSDTFIVVEKWSSNETLEAHAKAPHMQAYGLKVKNMLADRVIHIMAAAN